MLHYSRLQLATIVAVPIVTIILLWTLVIFYRNKRQWKCYDIAIIAILIQSVLRNSAIVSYTILQTINQSAIRFEYCTVFVWIFNSIHTFQASTLSTLAVVALFSIKLYRKKENLKNYLTVAHVIYHLFCLTTLCACVGVAAILAKQKSKEFALTFDFFPLDLCRFMPHEMDVKYNVFIITLHAFLAFISVVAFALTCYNFCAYKRDGFAYVKKSNSDLSELSIASTGRTYQRPFYEGYGCGKSENGQVMAGQEQWTSDTSNICTTVSSTNSRRPCLGKQMSEDYVEGVGLETILPILTVCYLFNHIPVIILCLFPWVLAPWSVATAALCLGLLQDVLIPLSLGLVDSRFCQWVSNVYHCSDRQKFNDKLPQVGLDGKFRPFGVHSPPEMEIVERQKANYQHNVANTEPKFPITNGSLYTSVDGRVPIIHNYRRHKDRAAAVKGGVENNNLINLGVHATYLKQQQDLQTNARPPQIGTNREQQTSYVVCSSCDQKNPIVNKRRISLSHQNGVERLGLNMAAQNRKLRLSKSEDSLREIEQRGNSLLMPATEKNPPSDSDDDYFSDNITHADIANRNSDDDDDENDSSSSSYSITTEANCDFDFYQGENERLKNVPSPTIQAFKPQQIIPRISTSKDNVTVVSMEHFDDVKSRKLDANRNFRITRSNSKRSLEDFKAYVDDNHRENTTKRSYSYVDLDDTTIYNNNKNNGKFESTWIGLDLSYTTDVLTNKNVRPSGSVPDLKKIFISGYL